MQPVTICAIATSLAQFQQPRRRQVRKASIRASLRRCHRAIMPPAALRRAGLASSEQRTDVSGLSLSAAAVRSASMTRGLVRDSPSAEGCPVDVNWSIDLFELTHRELTVIAAF